MIDDQILNGQTFLIFLNIISEKNESVIIMSEKVTVTLTKSTCVLLILLSILNIIPYKVKYLGVESLIPKGLFLILFTEICDTLSLTALK